MEEQQEIYALLPYLKTSGPVSIRGVQFQSTRDLDTLPKLAAEHLRTLASCFFLWEGDPIEEMICAFIPLPKKNEERTVVIERLAESQLLIAYLYTAPHPTGGTFMSSEHAALFTFQPARVPIWNVKGWRYFNTNAASHKTASDFEITGYQGTRNLKTPLFAAAESRIVPEVPHLWLSHTQDLVVNFSDFAGRQENWAIVRLSQANSCSDEVRERVFLALRWYMLSCRQAISETESLVNLAIAFESLLRLDPGEQLTDRFKEAVLTLLGRIPRLDDWLEQFYNARSKTVHEGRPRDLAYYARDKSNRRRSTSGVDQGIPHGNLQEYGLRVFRLCLNAILAGATQTHSVGLESLFVHNKERLDKICQILNDSTKEASVRMTQVHGIVSGLSSSRRLELILRPEVELKIVLGAARLLLQAFADTSPSLSEAAGAVLSEAVRQPAATERERLEQLKNLQAALAGPGTAPPGAEWTNRATMLAFLEYATQPALMISVLDFSAARGTPPSGTLGPA